MGKHDAAVELVPVEVLKEGTGVPLCCIHEGNGQSYAYRRLANYLDCPIIGINQIPQKGEAEIGSIRDMAKSYADRFRRFILTGPITFWAGRSGAPSPTNWPLSFADVDVPSNGLYCWTRCSVPMVLQETSSVEDDSQGRAPPPGALLAFQSYRYSRTVRSLLTYRTAEELIRQQRRGGGVCSSARQIFEFAVQNHNANRKYLREHAPDVFDGDMIIFAAARRENEIRSTDPQNWRPYVAGDITVHAVDCRP